MVRGAQKPSVLQKGLSGGLLGGVAMGAKTKMTRTSQLWKIIPGDSMCKGPEAGASLAIVK